MSRMIRPQDQEQGCYGDQSKADEEPRTVHAVALSEWPRLGIGARGIRRRLARSSPGSYDSLEGERECGPWQPLGLGPDMPERGGAPWNLAEGEQGLYPPGPDRDQPSRPPI